VLFNIDKCLLLLHLQKAKSSLLFFKTAPEVSYFSGFPPRLPI